MNKKPRIAFCFSGQARTLDQTYLFFQKNLFDAAMEQGFDYDVFCAVEDDEDVDKVKLLNPTKVEKIKSSDVEKIIEEKYGDFINGYLIKNSHIEFDVSRFLQQLYKVTESLNIGGYNYDIIFKLRFDCFFFNALNFAVILSEIENCNKVICNIPNSGIVKKFGFNFSDIWEISDLFFIGNNYSLDSLKKNFNEFIKNVDSFIVCRNRVIFKIFDSITRFVRIVNTKLGYWIFPVLPIDYFLLKFNIKTFIPESYYYCFLNNSVEIKKVNVSWILLRKDIEYSVFNLVPKTVYEL